MKRRVTSSKAVQALPVVNAKFMRFVNPSFHHTCRFFAKTAHAIVADYILEGLEFGIVKQINVVTFGRYKLLKKGLAKGLTQMLLDEQQLKANPSLLKMMVNLFKRGTQSCLHVLEQIGTLAGKGPALMLIPVVVGITLTLDGFSFLLNRVLPHNIDLAQKLGNGILLAGDILYINRECLLYFALPLLSFITTGCPILLLDNLVMVQSTDLASALVKCTTQLIFQGTRSEAFKDLQSMYQLCVQEGAKGKKVLLNSILKQLSLPILTLILCTIPVNRTAIISKHLKTMFEKFHYNLNVQALLMGSLVLTFNYLNKHTSQQELAHPRVNIKATSSNTKSLKAEIQETSFFSEIRTLGHYTAEAILKSYQFKLLNPFKHAKVKISSINSRLAA